MGSSPLVSKMGSIKFSVMDLVKYEGIWIMSWNVIERGLEKDKPKKEDGLLLISSIWFLRLIMIALRSSINIGLR